MYTITFTLQDVSNDRVPARIPRNRTKIFLLTEDIPDFAQTVTNLTSAFKNMTCRVRFASEIVYDKPLTLCKSDGVEVHNLAETLGKINSDNNNLPTEKISMIVPDDSDSQFIRKICRQLCLLRIPFEIRRKAYNTFVQNSNQLSAELEILQSLCDQYKLPELELTNKVTSLKKFLNQEIHTPKLAIIGQLPPLLHKLVFPVVTAYNPKFDGCIFVINGSVDELYKLDGCQKENILFVVTSDTPNLNVPVLLANTEKVLNQNGFNNALLTFADAETSVEGIIESFQSYLQDKNFDVQTFNDKLVALNKILSRTPEIFDDKPDNDETPKYAEATQAEIVREIDNAELLINDVLPKALFYDSRFYIEKSWRDFQKTYRDTFNQVVENIFCSNEQTLHALYEGYVPDDLKQFLIKNDFNLNDTYNHMVSALQKCITDFLYKRTCEFGKLLPLMNLDNISDNVHVEVSFNPYKIFSSGYLRETLSAEKLKALVRRNSKIVADSNVIFLENNFREECRQLLESGFADKAASAKSHLMWTISDAIENYWSNVSDSVYRQIETTKKNFVASIKERDAVNEQRNQQKLQYIKFFNEVRQTVHILRQLS